MSCREWQVNISAYLDGALDHLEKSEVLRHLENCQKCRDFYNEQRELSQFLVETAVELDPPAGIWRRIESEIGDRRKAGIRSRVKELFSHFEIPQMAYGFAALLLFGLASLLALQVYEEFSAHPAYLAELDSFSVEFRDNPFLEIEGGNGENPFWRSMVSNDVDLLEETNPFERYEDEEVVR
jgi:hypothetical protein